MALELKLDLKLTQKLILTPQLKQAIKLLQLPQIELAQAINQELEENPFLEEANDEEKPFMESGDGENNKEFGVDIGEEDNLIPIEKLLSFSVDEYFEDRISDGRDLGYFNIGMEETSSVEQFLKASSSLYDHLIWQLNTIAANEEVKAIAEVIIGNLDDNGYLKIPEEEIANLCNTSIEKVKEAIKVVQEIDPPGIGARDLQECLLLQIKELNLGGTLVEKIVKNNLKELEKKDYNRIAKQYKATIEDIMLAVNIISELDPKPARRFIPYETNYIIPDVFVEKAEEGYRIILNEEGVPRVRLNSYYRKLLTNKDNLTKEEKKFLTEKLRSAMWLIKSLDQRNRTIYKVTESILKFQREFFDKGHKYIKPLNLKDVAEDINMHESTVSRVTLNKYIGCAHGIFSFKFFFSSAIKGTKGKVSSMLVKEMIKKIIAEENPHKPYSDQKIVEILKSKNVKIARRTVAKYREELKIPPHSKRKKMMNS